MTIIHADTLEWVQSQPSKSVDHIITDYEYGTDFPILEFIRICKGTIITFCSELDNPTQGLLTKKAYWIKTPSTKNNQRELSRFVEEIHIVRAIDEYYVFNTNLHWSNYTGVYTDLVEDKGWLWKKPLSLMERLVRIYTNWGQIVLDPFMGSGTTLEACKKHGRDYVGIDKDERWIKYCKGIGL